MTHTTHRDRRSSRPRGQESWPPSPKQAWGAPLCLLRQARPTPLDLTLREDKRSEDHAPSGASLLVF